MKKHHLILLLFAVFAISCGKQLSVEELIEIEVESKMSGFKKQKQEACMQYILREAEILADSFMSMRVGNAFNDSITFGDRPERPVDSQGYEIELDTISPGELFGDSLGYEIELDTISPGELFGDSLNFEIETK